MPDSATPTLLTPRELRAWRGLLRVHATLVKALDAELERAHGLSLTSYEVLLYLNDAPEGRLRMHDLATSVLLSRSGLTRLADRLERDGFIEREACESDARGSFAVITAGGREKLATARVTHLDGVRRHFLSHLDAEAQDRLGDVWERILPIAGYRGEIPDGWRLVDGMRPRTASDRDVACPATRQHGLITRARMRDLGFGDRAISRRLAAGRLIAVHRGVSAVGHGALTQPARWLAAVLACGPGALLSHGSTAAALWGSPRPAGPHSRHAQRRRRGDGAARRLPAPLHDAGRRRPHAPRADPGHLGHATLLDLAAVVPRRKLRRAIAQADVLRRLRVEELERMLAAHPGRPGTPLLAGLLAEHRPQGGISRSDFEDRLVELCERYGLPAPRLNARIAGLEVDVSWPQARVVAEADSFSFHRTRAAFEDDRARDATLTAAGHIVHRFTERQVRLAPETVVAALRRSLADRGRMAS